MKRIIFILLAILLLSTPILALGGNGIPMETIVTLKGYPYTPIISKELDKAILYSSTFCPFVGQPYRVRLILDVEYRHVDTYLFKAYWYIRMDEQSVKFTLMDSQEGSWKLSEERKMATWFIDHAEELLVMPNPDEYYTAY